MAVDRFSLTLEPELGAAVREAAAAERTSVSAWLADAATQRLRHQRLRVALDAWEAEDGPLTEAELTAVRQALGAAAPGSTQT